MRLFIIVMCFVFLAGCSSGQQENQKPVVAQVNKYKMYMDDFQDELKNAPYDVKYILGTDEGKKEFIGNLVEKQVLLQEAQRQGLDREKDFMKSIENYWEQALLKSLLERKSKEIAGSIHVYDNEIEEYYRASGEQMSLPKVKSDIRRALRQEKETQAMNAWIEEMKKRSYIKINENILKDAFLDKVD